MLSVIWLRKRYINKDSVAVWLARSLVRALTRGSSWQFETEPVCIFGDVFAICVYLSTLWSVAVMTGLRCVCVCCGLYCIWFGPVLCCGRQFQSFPSAVWLPCRFARSSHPRLGLEVRGQTLPCNRALSCGLPQINNSSSVCESVRECARECLWEGRLIKLKR